MNDDSFAIRLLRAQSRAGISIRGLSRETGLERRAIDAYHEGRCEPTMKNLVKLAKALNVSADYLCGLEKKS
jgi:transcriptional regulator with XRE-family HTH domain